MHKIKFVQTKAGKSYRILLRNIGGLLMPLAAWLTLFIIFLNKKTINQNFFID